MALEAISQIFAGSGIRHTTTGTPKAPSVSYDDSELVAQEKAEAEESNQSYQEALIARKSTGAAKFGKGLLMVAVGALAIVTTGGTAVGVVVAGPAVLIGPVANTSVSLAFDLIPDGRLDTPWETYLNGFSTQCMVSAISMKIGKAGSCESYWSKVKSDLIQQTASSIIGGIGNGQFTIEGLVEDFVTQLISAPISNLTEHKVWSAILDTSLDSTIDLGSQVYHNGWDKVDWKQVLQTGVNTLVTKLIYSCDPVCVSKGFLFQYMEDLWFEDLYGKFIMARRYQSTFAYNGAFGKWWYHAYESFLIGEKGVLTEMLQDGHLESFVYQKNHWENTREGDHKYVLIEEKEKKNFV